MATLRWIDRVRAGALASARGCAACKNLAIPTTTPSVATAIASRLSHARSRALLGRGAIRLASVCTPAAIRLEGRGTSPWWFAQMHVVRRRRRRPRSVWRVTPQLPWIAPLEVTLKPGVAPHRGSRPASLMARRGSCGATAVAPSSATWALPWQCLAVQHAHDAGSCPE